MRKILFVLASCTILAGCVTTDTVNKVNAVAANIATASRTFNEKVVLTKQYIAQTCQYVPTTSSLVALFNSSLGAAVGTVGEAVCEAVRSAPLADGPANFRVNGVLVKGRFVR